MTWGNGEPLPIKVTATKIDLQFPPMEISTVCDEQMYSLVSISINRINGAFFRSEFIQDQDGNSSSFDCSKRAVKMGVELPRGGGQIGKCEKLPRALF